MKSVLCNFLLDFNRLLKNILKRPQQTATTTIFKGNPPKQTKNTKYKKSLKKQQKRVEILTKKSHLQS